MLIELGHFSLILAFCFTLLQVSAGFSAGLGEKLFSKNKALAYRLTASSSLLQTLLIAISFFILSYAFAINDFSVRYVVEHSSSILPIWYRLCAVWGAHEGSMLLWVFILALFSSAVFFMHHLQLPKLVLMRILGTLGLISSSLLLFILTTSNPFLRILEHIPAEGRDLNALLQDPGFLLHPPMLYMGYVGLSVSFAFSVSALLTKKLDKKLTRAMRLWTLVAWCFLTVGITLGSWWAYRELGWGGWWFWDPVENASFMPWLAATALIHSLIICEKKQHFLIWVILLAIVCFALSLLGTFLVRSGILTSVHAFALDPSRGLFMLAILAVIIGGALALFSVQARFFSSKTQNAPLSRETLLLTNNIFLCAGLGTILLGTLFPLNMSLLNLGKFTVGAPYFNAVFIPLFLPAFLVMGMAPFCAWQTQTFKDTWKKIHFPLLCSALLAIVLSLIATNHFSLQATCFLFFAFWIMAGSFGRIKSSVSKIQKNKPDFFVHLRSNLPMKIAHIGCAVSIIGMSLSTYYGQQTLLLMKVGEQVSLADYHFSFDQIMPIHGSNYEGIAGKFSVIQKGKKIATIWAETKNYPIQKTQMTDAGIAWSLFQDFYVVLGDEQHENQFVIRIYYKPFVRWIWLGGILMLIGGFFSFLKRIQRREKK